MKPQEVGFVSSVGTLVPPPAYGSERGSIFLEGGTGLSLLLLSPLAA